MGIRIWRNVRAIAAHMNRGRGFTVRMGRPDAIDVLRKWVSDATPLRTRFRFPLFELTFLGKIKEVSDARLSFLSDDTTSELALRLPDDLTFGYGDDRRFENEGLAGVILFFREAEDEADDPDTVSFFEVMEVR